MPRGSLQLGEGPANFRVADGTSATRYAGGMTLSERPAGIALMLAGGPLTRREIIEFSLVVGVGLLVTICWQIVDDWKNRARGRNWPTVSAVIDAVSVTFVESNLPSSLAVHNWPSYLATLTYSYRSPEPQTGDYDRRFGDKDEAQTWANSYKGETVTVHAWLSLLGAQLAPQAVATQGRSRPKGHCRYRLPA